MAITAGLGRDDEDEGALVAAINTTPLVDIMLVLLIIFLITIPVVTHTVPVSLPHERNQPTATRPDNIIVAIDKAGNVYWNEAKVADNAALLAHLEASAHKIPQPAIQIRADKDVRYDFVGRVVVDCQRAGIVKLAFLVEPERGAGAGGG